MKLCEAARVALENSPARAAIFMHNGQRYVAKAPGRGRGWLQALSLKAFCRLVFGCRVPLAPLRLVSGQARLEHEAARLRGLSAAGEAVPRVLALKPGLMVLEYVGNTVEQRLGTVPYAKYLEFLIPALNDLLRFHTAGHWHGGAQLKNLTLQEGRIFRIDLEEDLGEHLPLPLIQAFDLVAFVNSSTLLRKMDEPASIELAATLFRHYLQARPVAEIRAVLRQGLRALSILCTLLAPLRHRRGRSLARIFVLEAALRQSLTIAPP